MKRGEVWWVAFDPSVGGEINKTRPAVILSNDTANKYLNRVQVVPTSSQIDKVYPSEAVITIKGKHSKAMADQIATASKQRLKSYITTLLPDEIKAIERAVKLQLGLG